MIVKVKVLGAKEVINTIDFIEKRTNKDVQQTLKAIGQIGTDDAKDFSAFKTGRLKGSITYSIDGKQFGYQLAPDADPSRDRLKVNKEKDVVEYGTNTHYGPFVEAMLKEGGQFIAKSYARNKALFKELIRRAVKRGVEGK